MRLYKKHDNIQINCCNVFEGEEMSQTQQTHIKLVVTDEQELYNSFSPDNEFDESVKSYIKSKIVDQSTLKSLRLTVISQDPIDEERFRSATASWIRDEKASFRQEDKSTYLTLLGALIFGSIMLLMCIYLEKTIDVLQYSLMPIMGSLALGKAAGILVEDLPMIKARKWIFEEIEHNNVITFEYGKKNDTISCE